MTKTQGLPVAFIGMGVMGYPMAGHLQQAGHQVSVYNRTADKAERWVGEYGGQAAATPAAAAAGARVACLCVGNDDDVRSVVYGPEGVLAGLSPGSVLLDHTTTSAVLAEELEAACAEQDVRFMDAPVSGGQAGAKNGALTIMCGGDDAVFEAVRPVLDAYGQHAELMGPVGQGQRTKMVNQICITGILQGLSEGLLLAEECGLDTEQLVRALSGGAAGSWQMQNRTFSMAAGKFDFGFAINWMRKDLDIALAEAQRHGLWLETTARTDAAYARLQERGHGRSDTSALILDLRQRQNEV
ncbi:NAD(P)-dependent oxidoreductase [Natronospirillum operosum]|uniref:NAD(P)-dependent oxidoreductase n=1 Tax=Natronospirillum operosum TaxID=2759953 RepID=A0A4Z0WED2_9GAMM|nr:NAD(P)-dependent oxidoreductase [Natronospirillum operosum]TGG93291.1 NAD(P)-dependent oxidoreductase [Natronospirillum operosum]